MSKQPLPRPDDTSPADPAGRADELPPGAADDASPPVFTPEDVHARPPDHPPTENAPESEKAGLIFERS